EIEALAFSLAPKNKPVVLKTLARWLKVDSTGAEDAYLDLVRGVDRKPFAPLEGLRNAKRLYRQDVRNLRRKPEVITAFEDNSMPRQLRLTGILIAALSLSGASAFGQ